MDYARHIPCDLLPNPRDDRFSEDIRSFQGCPTLAATPGGRLYLAWYSGGTREPHIENYNLLIKSDDGGKTWSEPILVIPSNREKLVHALDIQLFCDPRGRLHVFWVQNNAKPAPPTLPEAKPGQPLVAVDGVLFDDFRHAMWESVCEDPDAAVPVFSPPRYLDIGFLRSKPLVMRDGRWLAFNYDQVDGRYGYSISDDAGESYSHRYAGKKLATPFDEGMAYEMLGGTVRVLYRSGLGELAESRSTDRGEHFSEATLSGIESPSSRFFIARTPTGRILLIKNDDRQERKNMTVLLSEDDGLTWPHRAVLDTRTATSYPDADFHGGRIYLTYDRERTGAREILFTSFTEEDVIGGRIPTPVIVSKPKGAT